MRISGLSVARSGNRIVEDADIDLEPGGITLVVGHSGVGKTSLLMSLAGAGRRVGLDVTGTLHHNGSRDVSFADLDKPVGGLVFQDASLYDDFAVSNNLAIVAGHHPACGPQTRAEIGVLLDGIPLDKLPNALSGGQRQRVAIARALIADQPLILMDEPNSGLDPARSRALAATLKRVAGTGRHIVIAAHHPEPFLSVATQVFYLDGEAGRLVPIANSYDAVLAQFDKAKPALNGAGKAPEGQSLLQDATNSRAVTRWPSEFLQRDLWSTLFDPASVIFVCVACALIGFTVAYLAVHRLPFAEALLPLAIDDIIAEIGYNYYRFTIPIMVSVLVAARTGAILTTDLSYKTMSGQIISLEQLGVPLRLYRSIGTIVALALSTVVLSAAAFVVTAVVIVAVIGLTTEEGSGFLRAQLMSQVFGPGGGLIAWQWVLAKTLLSGIIVAVVCLLVGTRPAISSRQINDRTALAIMLGVLAVLALHTAFIFVEIP